MHDLFCGSLETLGRTLVSTVLAYAAAILFLRTSGKRTLSNGTRSISS